MHYAGVLNSVAHAKGQWAYHIEWSPKYRYRMLGKESSRKDMEAILSRIASENGIKLLEIAVMPDHVHVVAEIPPRMSLASATQFLKGKSSYEFRKLHPNMLKRIREHLWSPGKFYRTIGDVNLDAARAYVRRHYDAHQTNLLQYGTPAL